MATEQGLKYPSRHRGTIPTALLLAGAGACRPAAALVRSNAWGDTTHTAMLVSRAYACIACVLCLQASLQTLAGSSSRAPGASTRQTPTRVAPYPTRLVCRSTCYRSRPSTDHTATSIRRRSSSKRTKCFRAFQARTVVAAVVRAKGPHRFGTEAIALDRSSATGAAAAMAARQASDSGGSFPCRVGMCSRRGCRLRRPGCLPHRTHHRARSSVAWDCAPWQAGPPVCARPYVGTRRRQS